MTLGELAHLLECLKEAGDELSRDRRDLAWCEAGAPNEALYKEREAESKRKYYALINLDISDYNP